MSDARFPSTSAFDQAILAALQESNDGLSNPEIEVVVARRLKLAPELLTVLHAPQRGARTEFSYRLAWAKTRLKARGQIERFGVRAWKAV